MELKLFADYISYGKSCKKYGFTDEHGNMVIPCEYDDAWEFHYGFAAVAKNDSGNMLWGFIDEQGKVICPLKYQKVEDFQPDGFAIVAGQGYSDDKPEWGLINTNGDIIVSCRFDYIENYGRDKNNEFISAYNFVDLSSKYHYFIYKKTGDVIAEKEKYYKPIYRLLHDIKNIKNKYQELISKAGSESEINELKQKAKAEIVTKRSELKKVTADWQQEIANKRSLQPSKSDATSFINDL